MVSVRIPLANNKGVASVSVEDAARVRCFQWSLGGNGYPVAKVDESTIYLHNLILGATPEGKWVDHRNRNRCDARRSNLRFCTPAENGWNRPGNPDSLSQYKGVWQDHRDSRWYAEITANYTRYLFGGYNNPEDAARAYDAAARFYHGVFAFTNFDGIESMSADDINRQRRANAPKATAPYLGVRFDPRYQTPWLVRLSVNRRCVLRTRFATAEEAAAAYDAKVRELGLSRRTNFSVSEEP